MTCPGCKTSLTVTAATCPKCGFPLLELPTVEDRQSLRWQAKTTGLAILVAVALALLGLLALIVLVDYYEEAHGIQSRNTPLRVLVSACVLRR